MKPGMAKPSQSVARTTSGSDGYKRRADAEHSKVMQNSKSDDTWFRPSEQCNLSPQALDLLAISDSFARLAASKRPIQCH
jgi:hypothetical protein